jgi:exodeoxyribonuclease VII large subunit
VSLLVAPVAVQGEDAPPQIAHAIAALDRVPDVDVIIVGRGGGSLEELWAFNDEVVARAIFQSRAPIVSAVGHETDFTIADFVADLRAPTPSAAAECVVPDMRELTRHLASETQRLRGGLRRHYERCRTRLDSQLRRPALARPLTGLRQRQQAVDMATRALSQAGSRLIDNGAKSLASLGGRLQALSPLATLARGYAVCQLADGSVVKDADRLHDGDAVKLTLARGAATCRVTAVEGSNR